MVRSAVASRSACALVAGSSGRRLKLALSLALSQREREQAVPASGVSRLQSDPGCLCPAACTRECEGYAERERREQPKGRPGDATSGARADRSERGTAITQIFQIVSADRSERGTAITQIFQIVSADRSERGTAVTLIS